MKLRNNQTGQALVESAFVLMIFLVMFIGIVDFGQFLYFHQSLSERARAAARYAAVHGTNTTVDTTAISNYAVYNDPAGTANGATALLPCIASSCTGNDGTAVQATVTATLSNARTDDARVIVSINDYPYNFFSPFMSKATWFRTVRASVPYEIGR
jgi:Flp pilus assembly protein TadG